RNFRQFLYKDGALGAQIIHHILVVYHFVADVDGCAMKLQRALDDVNGTVYAGAEAAGIGEDDLHGPERIREGEIIRPGGGCAAGQNPAPEKRSSLQGSASLW